MSVSSVVSSVVFATGNDGGVAFNICLYIYILLLSNCIFPEVVNIAFQTISDALAQKWSCKVDMDIHWLDFVGHVYGCKGAGGGAFL